MAACGLKTRLNSNLNAKIVLYIVPVAVQNPPSTSTTLRSKTQQIDGPETVQVYAQTMSTQIPAMILEVTMELTTQWSESTCYFFFVLSMFINVDIMQHCQWQQRTDSLEARQPFSHSLQYLFGMISPASMPWGRVMRHPWGPFHRIQNLGLKQKAIPAFPLYSRLETSCRTLLTTWNLTVTTSDRDRYIALIRAFYDADNKYFLNRDIPLMSIFVILWKRWS